MNERAIVAGRLEEAMREASLTVYTLSRRAGLHPVTIFSYLRPRATAPDTYGTRSQRTLRRLAAALDKPADFFEVGALERPSGFGAACRRARRARAWSLQDGSRASGLSPALISMIESGARRSFSRSSFLGLCNALGLDPEAWIYPDKEANSHE